MSPLTHRVVIAMLLTLHVMAEAYKQLVLVAALCVGGQKGNLHLAVYACA